MTSQIWRSYSANITMSDSQNKISHKVQSLQPLIHRQHQSVKLSIFVKMKAFIQASRCLLSQGSPPRLDSIHSSTPSQVGLINNSFVLLLNIKILFLAFDVINCYFDDFNDTLFVLLWKNQRSLTILCIFLPLSK